jgi:hypothetical protein
MQSLVIEQRACPRCQIRRTVRLARTSFCFNCRWTWGATASADSYAFGHEELARLRAYRDAIRNGFFTDELPAIG